jgi:hypothetical protein
MRSWSLHKVYGFKTYSEVKKHIKLHIEIYSYLKISEITFTTSTITISKDLSGELESIQINALIYFRSRFEHPDLKLKSIFSDSGIDCTVGDLQIKERTKTMYRQSAKFIIDMRRCVFLKEQIEKDIIIKTLSGKQFDLSECL